MEHNWYAVPGGMSETGREVGWSEVPEQGDVKRFSSPSPNPAVNLTNTHLPAHAPTGNEGQRQTGQEKTTYNLALKYIFGDRYGEYGNLPMTYGAQQQRSALPRIVSRRRSMTASTPYSRPNTGSQIGLTPMEQSIRSMQPNVPVRNYGRDPTHQRHTPYPKVGRYRSSGVRPADTEYQTEQKSTSAGKRLGGQSLSAVAGASMSYQSNQYASTSQGFLNYLKPMQGNMVSGYGTHPNQQGLPNPPHLQVQYPGGTNCYQYQYNHQYSVPNHQSEYSSSYGSNHPPTLPPQTLPLVPRSAPTQTDIQSAPGLRLLSFRGPPERPVADGDPDVITLDSSESDEERSSGVRHSSMVEGEVNAEERNLAQQGENIGKGGSTTEMSDEEETEFSSAEEYPLEILNESLAMYAQNKTNKSGVKRDFGKLISQALIGKDGKESAVAASVEVFQVAETDDTASDDSDGIPPKRPRLGAFCSQNNLIMGMFAPVENTKRPSSQ